MCNENNTGDHVHKTHEVALSHTLNVALGMSEEEDAKAHDCFIAIIYQICNHGSNIRRNLVQV